MLKTRKRMQACAAALALLLPGLQTAQAQGQNPFVGQLAYVAFNFAPAGWQECDGSLLPIAEYDALFNLIGTTYGGDGESTFAVPDLRGRMPIHQGPGFIIGQEGGSEIAAVNSSNLPLHTHSVSVSAALPASSAIATSGVAAGHALANTGRNLAYSTSAPNVMLGTSVPLSHGTSTGLTGGGQAFDVVPPYLTVNCIISLFGVFPTQN